MLVVQEGRVETITVFGYFSESDIKEARAVLYKKHGISATINREGTGSRFRAVFNAPKFHQEARRYIESLNPSSSA